MNIFTTFYIVDVIISNYLYYDLFISEIVIDNIKRCG